MNWLSIIQLVAALGPEVVALITAITGAVNSAPPEHQAAVQTAMTNLIAKK